MDDEQRAELTAALAADRDRTQQRINALTRDFDDIVERSGDASRDDEHDPEGATIAFERAQVSALLDSNRANLDDIEVALRRLEAAKHHRCEHCGNAIPFERHLARPTTRTCINCADIASR